MFANGIWCLPPLFSILPFVWVNTTVNASQHKLPKFLPTWGNVNMARADTSQTGEWNLNIANLCKSQVVLEAFLWSVATLYENIFRRWVFRLNTFCLFLYAAFSKINYPNGIMRLGWVSHSTFNYSLCLRDGTRKKQVFHSKSFHTRNAELICLADDCKCQARTYLYTIIEEIICSLDYSLILLQETNKKQIIKTTINKLFNFLLN